MKLKEGGPTILDPEASPEAWTDSQLSLWMADAWESLLTYYSETFSPEVLSYTTSFLPTYKYDLPQETHQYLTSNLEGKPLIDLGCGASAQDTAKTFIKKYRIGNYNGVDLGCIECDKHINGSDIKIERGEALSFLSKQADASAAIMSNGFLSSEIVGRTNPVRKEYIRRIFGHINRILPQDGIFFATGFNLEEFAQESGLNLERQEASHMYTIFKSYRKQNHTN